MRTFGKLIRQKRKEKNWTQDHLASAIGHICTSSYISKLESASPSKKGLLPRVGAAIVDACAVALDIPPSVARASAGIAAGFADYQNLQNNEANGALLSEFIGNYEILEPKFQSFAIRMCLPILANLYDLQRNSAPEEVSSGSEVKNGSVSSVAKKVLLYNAATTNANIADEVVVSD